MALYELAVVGGAGTINVNQLEFRAGADPCYVQEIGLFLNAATASSIGLGRPANTVGVGGTLVLGQANVSDDVAAKGGIVSSGWSTAPTAPTVYMRRIGLPAAIGNGIVWTFPKGLRVKQATSLTLFNIAASSIVSAYFSWEE